MFSGGWEVIFDIAGAADVHDLDKDSATDSFVIGRLRLPATPPPKSSGAIEA